MVRAEAYHAVHLEYLPIINLERNVPSLASFRAITCLRRHERGSDIYRLIVICCEQWSVQSGTVQSGSTSQITSGLFAHCGLTAKVQYDEYASHYATNYSITAHDISLPKDLYGTVTVSASNMQSLFSPA
jgi:hypothetical protein